MRYLLRLTISNLYAIHSLRLSRACALFSISLFITSLQGVAMPDSNYQGRYWQQSLTLRACLVMLGPVPWGRLWDLELPRGVHLLSGPDRIS
jgi:hypothetical protein